MIFGGKDRYRYSVCIGSTLSRKEGGGRSKEYENVDTTLVVCI